MQRLHNDKLKNFSQTLRKNMTKEEKQLWYQFLKKLPQTVYRQKPLGNYIVDFYCPSARLIIELDGSQHYTDKGANKDEERDGYFNSLDITVLRFSNLQINEKFKDVCEEIYKYL